MMKICINRKGEDMIIKIRKFQKEDISYKVSWINDKRNNKFLHYDLPLRVDKTLQWFNLNKARKERIDYTITYDNEPVGLIGLLNIDIKNKKAEFYIILGSNKFKNKGIGHIASDLMIKECFSKYELNKIYLYTEVDNFIAQKLFERIGFIKEGLLKEDLIQEKRTVDRFVYGLNIKEYLNKRN